MSDWPGFGVPAADIALGPRQQGGVAIGNWVPNASGTWPVGSLALYFPFRLDRPRTVVKLFCANGAAVSGNVDLGIYDVAGTKLVSSGATAQAGTSAIQEFDVTDTLLGGGLFYLAVVADNTTATFMRSTQLSILLGRMHGVRQQAAAYPLPVTATFAVCNAAYFPAVGATARVVV